jgi:hypothetical protein
MLRKTDMFGENPRMGCTLNELCEGGMNAARGEREIGKNGGAGGNKSKQKAGDVELLAGQRGVGLGLSAVLPARGHLRPAEGIGVVRQGEQGRAVGEQGSCEAVGAAFNAYAARAISN